jgi:hypothetical protein
MLFRISQLHHSARLHHFITRFAMVTSSDRRLHDLRVDHIFPRRILEYHLLSVLSFAMILISYIHTCL